MTKDAITIIQYIFNSILNGISSSFLSSIPLAIKVFIDVLFTSAIVFVFLVSFGFLIGFIYFVLRDLFKNEQNKTISTIIQNEFNFLRDKIKNPITDGFWIRVDKKALPLITILLCFILGLKETLPLIAVTIVSNDKVAERFKFKLNPWLFAFLITIILVYFVLLK